MKVIRYATFEQQKAVQNDRVWERDCERVCYNNNEHVHLYFM